MTTLRTAALRAALEAPPPEPVGWVYIDRATGQRTYSRHMAGVVNHTEVVEVPVYAEPFHAEPPRREWRGLTEEEIDAALPHEPGDLDFVCARAIEAALKEKNA